MEIRAIIAVTLSIAVFYIFSTYFAPEGLEPTKAVPTVTAVTENKNTPAPVQSSSSQKVTSGTLPSTTVDASYKEIIVETDLYSAIFSARGASLKRMTLKNYREDNSPNSSKVILGADSDPNLFSFSTRGFGFNLPENSMYVADSARIKTEGGKAEKLVFSHVSGQGFTVRKSYTFTPGNYAIKLETEILNNSPAPIVGAFQHIMTYPPEPKVVDNRFETAGSFLYSDKSLHTNVAKDVAAASKRYDKTVEWAGFGDRYFISAILAENNSIATVELKKNGFGFFESAVTAPHFTVNSGGAHKTLHRLFVGPKDIDILKAQSPTFEESLDLGWFTVLANPLLYSLKFFNGYVGNYGVAIIIITIILKVLFFPLTHKSFKSMKEMQKIQPAMMALKEKYKNDREKLNQAVMELYKQNKVNPMGGCLPMLVQIPVFFALYKALMFSIELRHAPFYLWVTDLSDKDPYYITPIIMGVTMFIQQKMTPSQLEPLQQKIMLALPVVFTFMFLTFPSGLVLYWMVNNILTIGQQMYINKIVKD